MIGVPSSTYNSVLTLTCINPSGGTGTGSWIWEYRATGTFVLTATYGFSSQPTTNCVFTLYNYSVSLEIDGLSNTSNSNLFRLSGLPSIITPIRDAWIVVPAVEDNGTFYYSNGGIRISATGWLYPWFYNNLNGDSFTSSGVKGFGRIAVNYSLL